MCMEATNWVLKNSPYKGVARTIHIILAVRARSGKLDLWPTQQEIAFQANTNVRMVGKVLQQMYLDGYLIRTAKGYKGKANNYRLILRRANPLQVIYEQPVHKSVYDAVHEAVNE